MKKIVLTALFALFATTFLSAQNGVKFEEGTSTELLAKASAQKKPLFVHFYTASSGPYKYMNSGVFSKDPAGSYFNSNFVNAKFDAEKGDGIALAKQYAVKSYPTFLILDASGKEVGRITGGYDAEEFIGLVKAAMK